MKTVTPTTVTPLTSIASRQIQIRALSSDEVAAALDAWRTLETRLNHRGMSDSALWTEIWIKHYGDLIPHEFLIAESDGVPRGICLITHSRFLKDGPFPLRSVHLGTAGEPDADSVFVEYNRLLVEDEYRSQFCKAIIDHVQRDRKWDQFQLDGFREEDAADLLDVMPGATVCRRESTYFDYRKLRDDGDDVISEFRRNTRANIRRQLRNYGDLTTEWVDSLTQAEEVFSELVTLHQQRWTSVGEPGVFASRRFHDFQVELLTRSILDRRVELFRARQGQNTLGCLLMLVDHNRLLGYLSGFAPFEGRASPGLVTHYLSIEEAMHRGYDAYDFLVGEHQHKQSLSNATTDLLWITWRRKRLKFRAVEAARRVKRLIPRR